MLCISHTHAYGFCLHQLLCAVHILGRRILEHFQSQGRCPAHRTQCGGYWDSHHSGAGDSHPHPVLENIGAHLDVYLEICVAAPSVRTVTRTVFHNYFRGLGYGQGYGYRFRTAQCGLDF